ncbi:hypothetical protein ACFW24_38285 [Streptomyces nigra]|uniref:hypothetical protein n=1 Tax=Streptomyces nigra TaxID=1827580 RepID=UPI0036991CA2
MITNVMRRSLPALLLAALPLIPASLPAVADSTALPQAATDAPEPLSDAGVLEQVLPLFDAIDRLPIAVEHREGYDRRLYKHWNKGLDATDGCNTRKEVILAESVEAPRSGTAAR